MSSMSPVPLQLSPLRRQSMAQLVARAEAMTIGQIMGPVRQAAGAVGEAEIVALVKKARADHRREAGRRKKR